MNATWLTTYPFYLNIESYAGWPPERERPVVWMSSNRFDFSADMRSVDRKQRLFPLAVAAAFNHHSGSPHALACGLTVVWVSITDANNPTIMFCLIDVRAVYRVNTKAHHVAGFSRNWDGIG